MVNAILVVILLAIIGSSTIYVYKAKKSGKKCIGCPHANQCGSKSCNCGSSTEHTSKQ